MYTNKKKQLWKALRQRFIYGKQQKDTGPHPQPTQDSDVPYPTPPPTLTPIVHENLRPSAEVAASISIGRAYLPLSPCTIAVRHVGVGAGVPYYHLSGVRVPVWSVRVRGCAAVRAH